MSARTADHPDDAESNRWRKLRTAAVELAGRHGRIALVVRDATRWLDQTGGRVRAEEIVVTWSVPDAELIRYQLRQHLDRDRIFAAAPRARNSPSSIPAPRPAGDAD